MICSSDTLPGHPLVVPGKITSQFLGLGIGDFHTAARFVHRLPYGRNTDRTDYSLVLPENRGTCSTKHALLARLAEEQSFEGILLSLGIYEMSQDNTPGVGPVLSRYDLASVPEAHCYLTYAGTRVDLTSPMDAATGRTIRFLYEQTISPEGIGSYKTTLHEVFLRGWAKGAQAGGHNWRELLSIREECIAALSE